jgi:hypothetical protein
VRGLPCPSSPAWCRPAAQRSGQLPSTCGGCSGALLRLAPHVCWLLSAAEPACGPARPPARRPTCSVAGMCRPPAAWAAAPHTHSQLPACLPPRSLQGPGGRPQPGRRGGRCVQRCHRSHRLRCLPHWRPGEWAAPPSCLASPPPSHPFLKRQLHLPVVQRTPWDAPADPLTPSPPLGPPLAGPCRSPGAWTIRRPTAL